MIETSSSEDEDGELPTAYQVRVQPSVGYNI